MTSLRLEILFGDNAFHDTSVVVGASTKYGTSGICRHRLEMSKNTTISDLNELHASTHAFV